MKTHFKTLIVIIFTLFSTNALLNAHVEYVSTAMSDALIMEYGYPVNIDYSYYWTGGCFSTEGAPLPWGQFNGEIDKTYFIGGDCNDFWLDIDFNMISGDDKVLIYELDYYNNLVVTAVINGCNDFENLEYSYQHMLINREAFVYLRIIKTSADVPSLYYNDSYYMFRGIYWWLHSNQ